MVLSDKAVGSFWGSEAGDTTESNSMNIEEEFLVEETNVDYGEKDFLKEKNNNQTPKEPKIVTKQALGKPLSKINFLDSNNDDILLDGPVKKLVVVRKLFSKINGFGEASTPSKFVEIIRASFTSNLSLAQAFKKAENAKILVNTNLKKSTGHLDWTVMMKKIPVGTLAEAVHTVLSEFGIIKLIKMQLSILIGKNVVHVARLDLDKVIWNKRDLYRALLYILSVETNAHDIWNFIGSVGEKMCVIDYHLVMYAQTRCAVVCFESAKLLDAVMRITPVLKGVHLHWFYIGSATCAKCRRLDHTSLGCGLGGKLSSGRLPYQMLSNSDKSRLVTIYAKHLAPVTRPVTFGSASWTVVVSGSSFSSLFEMKPTPLVSLDINNRFATLECSFVSLVKCVNKLAKRLDTPGPTVSQLRADIVMSEGLGVATGDKTVVGAVVFDPLVVLKMEETLRNLSVMVMNLLAKIDNAGLVPHKDMGNLISIFMKSKLKGKVCLWIASRFDGVWVSKVPGWLLYIKLLFKNKLSVSILGFYAGASLAVWFSQASKINSLIAKTVNKSSFIILDGDFNKDESVKKTINYVFISLNLINVVVYHGISDVSKHFDTDYQAVSVSLGLDGLLDTYLISLHKQVNRNCWKFDIKNANKAKWFEFRDNTVANAVMFSDAFGFAIIVFLADSAFKRKWFKSFDGVFTKKSSRFHKLELLISKLVKTSCLIFCCDFVALLETWDKLNSTGALEMKFLFLLGSNFNLICSALAKHTEESHIKQAIARRMESFELGKSHTIRSVLEHLFCKVVLDHLVVGDELILELNLVKSKVDEIMEGWTRKCKVVCQFQPLNYVFDGAFSGVMCLISLDEMSAIVKNLSNEKAAGLFGTITQSPIFAIGSVVKNALEKNRELWLVLQDMRKTYNLVGWKHFRKSLVRIKMCDNQAATQHILDVASEFFRFNNIFINNDKTVAVPINCQVTNSQLDISGLSIFIAKKGESHRYLGIFLLTESLSKSHDLQIFNWCSHHPLLFLTCVGVNLSNNFLAGVVHIFSGCDLSLGNSLACAFYFWGSTFMSMVLSKPYFLKCVLSLKHYGIAFVEQLQNQSGGIFNWKTFKCWKRLDSHRPVPFWFDLSVRFLEGDVLFFGCSSLMNSGAVSDVCRFHGFSVICNNLLATDAACLSVYIDGSLCGLGTIDMKADAAVFFRTLTQMVNLFSDSQAALDACKSKSFLAHPVRGHLGVLGNECIDMLAKNTTLSAWQLPHLISKKFLRASDTAVSGSSRHFIHNVGLSFQIMLNSLHANINWSKSSMVWHMDFHLAASFTNMHTAGLCTYFIKAFHHQLLVAVCKHLFNRCYPSVICLFCGDVEVFDHVFCCPFNAAGCAWLLNAHASVWKVHLDLSQSFLCILQLLYTCVSDVAVGLALCKGFVFNDWYHESGSVFRDPKIAMLIPCDGSISTSVSGLSTLLLAGVVRLLGIAEAFGIGFGFYNPCSFFLGIENLVSVHISV
ncbi:hypothetical protein G9A89_005829 [Geosiphon pyriformis]|nr:hypothetical protein G9A89_005829 [Geosiphon pyriformis]